MESDDLIYGCSAFEALCGWSQGDTLSFKHLYPERQQQKEPCPLKKDPFGGQIWGQFGDHF